MLKTLTVVVSSKGNPHILAGGVLFGHCAAAFADNDCLFSTKRQKCPDIATTGN
jgi:hypothetical protein